MPARWWWYREFFQTAPASSYAAPQTYSWKLDGTPWTIHNHANVFARSGLDIGARFFLQL
jgi:16S rRNA G1207 methylase RsmC